MRKPVDFRNMQQTQFDFGQVLKGSFSELNSSLRTVDTNAILKDTFTHFTQVLNVNGFPTQVDYYQALSSCIDRINFSADVNQSKAGTYFTLQEFITKRTHVFWYRVDGNGTAPGIGDVETVIDISENDPSNVIAYITKITLDSIPEYVVVQNGYLSSFLDIEYFQFGETQAVNVGTTGFLTNRIKQGESKLVGTVLLDYDGNNNPIYNGNLLKGLKFNQFTASFDVELSDVNVSINTASNFSVQNVVVPLANTEVQITIPNGTKRFILKTREPNTQMYISNTTNGPYITIPYGEVYKEDDVSTISVTLYVKLSRDARNLELLSWS